MRRHLLVLFAGFALTVAACGDSDMKTTDGPSTGDSDPSPSETLPTVPEQDASLIVFLSSERPGGIAMRAEVDGQLVFDQAFESSSGHNNQVLPFDLSPGAHQISVEADDGTTLDLPFELPDDDRYLIVNYWPAESEGDAPTGGEPYFEHQLTATPPSFA